MNRALIDWWAAFREIRVDPSICPASPEGQRQTANAVIAVGDWHSAFTVAAVITVVLAVIMVLVAYETRVMGDRFWKRWWGFLAGTSVLAMLASLLWLATTSVRTEACEFGNVATRIPFSYAFNRSTVSLLQGLVLFVVLSWLLTLIARATKRAVWYNNSRIPFRF